ncbi:hypothetical protein I547_3610 [Mycobacterium kansasii 824]|uniref:Uncharacterized protein n=1 Tax=Mycobacterium kansasii TaxID=1768 RepID=A0A1V3XK99_MYCKA|nr:hypothetical protein I547_3610 [Mycobacterium kansasii 824]OOK78891.1 hypothetical protein BZL30_2545 [Mycobacterium kansasii]OOK80449.1 hypothetical protein BZL29_2517 [Mycobacterium kansasii]
MSLIAAHEDGMACGREATCRMSMSPAPVRFAGRGLRP